MTGCRHWASQQTANSLWSLTSRESLLSMAGEMQLLYQKLQPSSVMEALSPAPRLLRVYLVLCVCLNQSSADASSVQLFSSTAWWQSPAGTQASLPVSQHNAKQHIVTHESERDVVQCQHQTYLLNLLKKNKYWVTHHVDILQKKIVSIFSPEMTK